ncbi:MAG: U32 family peptidase, partial [Eubacterium sp.]|nr:U32 family peptidase [Eubacterium sp.]
MPELLAPAGSYETMLAVFEAGADAVYLAGDCFGARAYAKNFMKDELLKALEYAHLHHKKIYLTVNTLLKDREIMDDLYEYLHPYVCNGLDALLVQDWGVFHFVRTNFPDLELHASTQMSISSMQGAKFLQDNGASRIVLSRELSLADIAHINKEVQAELEVFAHGALCYSYSGKCLMSSLIGGRSGNRGRCAQPCRLAYQLEGYQHDAEYLMSLKDLSTIDILPQMLEAGAYSFKIEGRMKQTRYAHEVVTLYRKYLDEALLNPVDYRVSKKDRERLLAAGNRCGFTDGYLSGHINSDMITYVMPSHKKEDTLKAEQTYEEHKIPIDVEMEFRIGSPAVMTLKTPQVCVRACGDEVSEAKARPLTKEEAIKKGAAFGTSPFTARQVKVCLDDHAFYNAGAIKSLRRKAVDLLTRKLIGDCHKEYPSQMPDKIELLMPSVKSPYTAVLVSTKEQLDCVSQADFVDCVYVAYDLLQEEEVVKSYLQTTNKQAGVVLPYVIKDNTTDEIKKV